MKIKKRKMMLTATLLSTLSLLVVPASVLALRQDPTSSDLVGVNVGDWVKYRITKKGSSVLWRPSLDEAEWIKAEVQKISGTVLTVVETLGLSDGSQANRTYTQDLQKDWSVGYYVVVANLSAGDKIAVNETVWINRTHSIPVRELSINGTTSKSYGEAIREVNWLRFSYLAPYFWFMYNFTVEDHFDKKTGFLVEKTLQVYAPYSGGESISTFQLEIVSTNLWKMEEQSNVLSQLIPWISISVVTTIGASAYLYERRRRRLVKNEN